MRSNTREVINGSKKIEQSKGDNELRTATLHWRVGGDVSEK